METPVSKPEGNGQPAPAAPQGQPAAGPTNEAPKSVPTPGQADTKNAPNLDGADKWEWDGNPNTVPPQFQKFAKGIQKHFTQRSMTEAEVRRKGQEYDQFVQSERFKTFQTWEQSQNGQPAPAARQPEANPSMITQAEWEDAQLDPTGQKAQQLMDRVATSRAQSLIDNAIKQYGGQVQELRNAQEQNTFNTALSDFADLHPDSIELHEMGLIKPRIEEELSSRRHKTYESAIQSAYEKACEARELMKSRLMQEQSDLVRQKKDAITLDGVGSGEQTTIAVSKEDAFATAFKNAAQGRKVKNKLK
jgi:hypothetical protein